VSAEGSPRANLGFRGYTSIRRPPAELVARLAEYAPPDLSDVMRGVFTLDPAIRPTWPFAGRVAGPAVTVVVPAGSFNVVRFAMHQARSGDVLVINARGITAYSMFGGNVAKAMRRRGIAGVVVDGAARDADEAQAVGCPVFARAPTTASPPYEGTGEVNVPIACGGVVVRPGDVIVADATGIVAVPPEGAQWVLEQAAALRSRFDAMQPTLERGEVANIAAITEELLKQGFAVDA